MVVDKLIKLFELLEENWPTEEGHQTHCITYSKEDKKLYLSIFYKGVWMKFNPEDNELDDLEESMEEIKKWLT